MVHNVGRGTLQFEKMQPLFWGVPAELLEGQLRSILRVRSIFEELPSLDPTSSPNEDEFKHSYLPAILVQTFMAGVQELNMDELEQAYRAIPRARIPFHEFVRDNETRMLASETLTLAKLADKSATTVDSLLDFWHKLFVDVRGGLDVMEGLEHSYMSRHQWKAKKITTAMESFTDEFDAMLRRDCGTTWAQLKTSINSILLVASKTLDFDSRSGKVKSYKTLDEDTELVSAYLENYSKVKQWIARCGLGLMEEYNDFVSMMRDRVKYNDMFKAVFLQAVCTQLY